MFQVKNRYKVGFGFVLALLLLGGFNVATQPNHTDEFLGISCLSGGSPSKADIIVYVTDPQSNPLNNVNVTLTKGSQIWTAFTGSDGHATFEKRQFGNYNASISKSLYHNLTDSFHHGSETFKHYILVYYDVYPPEYSNLNTNASSPLNFTKGLKVQFNATWNDADSGIDAVQFYLDGELQPGVSNVSSEYYITLEMVPGIHLYYWWANDTFNNMNQTPVQGLSVLKPMPEIKLKIHGIGIAPIFFINMPLLFEIETSIKGNVSLQIYFVPVFTGYQLNNTWYYIWLFNVPLAYNVTATIYETENFSATSITRTIWVFPFAFPDLRDPLLQVIAAATFFCLVVLAAATIATGISYGILKRKYNKLKKGAKKQEKKKRRVFILEEY